MFDAPASRCGPASGATACGVLPGAMEPGAWSRRASGGLPGDPAAFRRVRRVRCGRAPAFGETIPSTGQKSPREGAAKGVWRMSTSNTAIETKGVTKTFGGFTAVNKVTYSLGHKEVAGIIGPNGAGKTTFFNLITGAYIPDEGSVFYGDKDVTKLPPQGRVSLGVRRTFQLASTFDNLKVVDNLKIAYFRTHKGSSIAGMLCTKMDCVADRAIADQLERFGLSGVAETATKNLSLGDKRKLEMAMALIGKPAVLLLDEPFAGLSEREIDETIDILREYVQKISILIVEHKITKLKTFVERVTVLANGEIIADGGFEEVLHSPAVRKSYWQID